jgi:glucose-1-phosphate thymidylyltransferase
MTQAISKQLLPVYDKPMIYYPLSTLMLAGIQEILVISTPKDLSRFQDLLGDGSAWGIELSYAEQPTPDGVPQAFLIGEAFLGGAQAALILGDNLFYGNDIMVSTRRAVSSDAGATLFAYRVVDPERYGVVDFEVDSQGRARITALIEKPENPPSAFAVTGLYFFDERVSDIAKTLRPSSRGELEILDLAKHYLQDDALNLELLGRGMAWLDTGTCDSLHEASAYIRTLEKRQGLKIGCPEEVAWRQRWISDQQLADLAAPLHKSGYGAYLESLLLEAR